MPPPPLVIVMAAVLVSTCWANRIIPSSHIGGILGSKQRHMRRIFSKDREYHADFIPNLQKVRPMSGLAFITFSSPYIDKRRCEQQLTTFTAQEAAKFPALLGGRCKLHSTTILMAKRKKNGGKSKKAKLKQQQLAVRNSISNGSDDDNETLIQTLTDALDTEEESAPEFTATFASEYHAPVMPAECIDALLKQGEWGEMLRARKERWRKKRSINEAKRRRAGYDDDDDEGEDAKSDADGDEGGEGAQLSTSSSPATPNQLDETNEQPRLFIDGTLGGGGHSSALLEQLNPGDVLIGCDVDPEALATASIRLVEYLATCEYILDKDSDEQPKCAWERGRPMFIPVQSNFRSLVSVLSKVRHPVSGRLILGDRAHALTDGIIDDDDDDDDQVEFPGGVNGMLLDLGVSSHQIDTSDRGFAFMKEGPLDMRMSGSNSQVSTLTAADICNEFDEATLIDILRTYGDEPRAKRISSAIVASRPLHTTTDLVHAINSVTPTFARQKRAGLIATSARVFQALRIVVNEEDEALKEVLESSGGVMTGDGILAILSYHSMEDKMAKRVIRDGKVDLFESSSRRRGGSGALERDIYGNIIGDAANVPFEPLAKPKKASVEEVAANSRSRSATLRVAVRI